MTHLKKARFFLAVMAIILSAPAFSQNALRGTIRNSRNNDPIPYASIGILRKNAGSVSDSSGNFTLELAGNLDYYDTVIISSIGYHEKHWLLKDFMVQKIFLLEPTEAVLKEIKVTPFRHETTLGSVSQKKNSLSGWSGSGKGGEIGNVFSIGAQQFKLEKLSFYILTGCDTTWFRVHIREFSNGKPGTELLSGNLILQVTKQEGISEHDLSQFNIIISDHPEIYVSLELIARSATVARPALGNNVHITGHKEGVLYYKWFPQTQWLRNDYSLSLMLKIKY
ncbi:MAG: carboxypeptidase-like regulatory domain-containing protein [Bacteroidota bacterium]